MFRQAVKQRLRPGARSLLAIAFGSVFLASCGVGKDMQTAEKAVGEFHTQLDSEQYHSIYTATSDQFRNATSEADFVALLQAVHRKLGNVHRAQRRGFNVNYNTKQGEVVTLDYSTEFDGGSGSERFLFQFSSSQPFLLGYHINSNALILK